MVEGRQKIEIEWASEGKQNQKSMQAAVQNCVNKNELVLASEWSMKFIDKPGGTTGSSYSCPSIIAGTGFFIFQEEKRMYILSTNWRKPTLKI